MPNFSKMNGGRTGNGTAQGMSHGMQNSISYVNRGNGTLDGMSKHIPNPTGHTEKMKNFTVPVQFQYGAHSTRDGNSFQDHHILCTSSNDSNRAVGKCSTCKCIGNAKYFMEWTSSTLCTCPQAAKTGFQTRRLISLEKSPASAQWKDFCEQTPIDKARHSVTLFRLL